MHNCFNAFGALGDFPLEPGQTSRGLRRRLGSLFRMTEQPTEYGATWVDLTQVAVPPAGVRAARFREAGKILSRMMKASVAPMPAGSLRTTGRSDLALLQHTVQIGVFLDFMQYPRPHWHLSISAVSGLRRETRTAVSVEEIGAWVQAGFPAATAFRTYTLASVVARHAEITTPSSGESAN